VLALTFKTKASASASQTTIGLFDKVFVAFTAHNYPTGIFRNFPGNLIIVCILYYFKLTTFGTDTDGAIECLYDAIVGTDIGIHLGFGIVKQVYPVGNLVTIVCDFLIKFHQ